MTSQVALWVPGTLQPIFARQCPKCHVPLPILEASPQYISPALMNLWREIGTTRARADYHRVLDRNRNMCNSFHIYHSCPICPTTAVTSSVTTMKPSKCACGVSDTYTERGFSCIFCDKWLCGLNCYKAHMRSDRQACLTFHDGLAVPHQVIGRAWCPFCRESSPPGTVKFRDDVWPSELTAVDSDILLIKERVQALIAARRFRDVCHRFTVHHRICVRCRPLLVTQWIGDVPLLPLDHPHSPRFHFDLSDVPGFFFMPHAQCIRILRQPNLRFLQYVTPPYTRRHKELFMAAAAELTRLRTSIRPTALPVLLWSHVESYVPEMWGQLTRFVDMGHHIDRTIAAWAILTTALRR